ncbi:MAG: hypothetical protein NTY98_08215 [Verrucomicrobia bacterium]|nr:hypothetical protein [Verrucomicrobiota bacterium]
MNKARRKKRNAKHRAIRKTSEQSSINAVPIKAHQPTMMEIAIQIIAALAAILTVVVGVLFILPGHRDAAIWTSCTVVCLIVIGTFCWFQDRAWKADKLQAEASENREVALRFVYTNWPALMIENRSNVTEKDIKWAVVLWNLNLPDRADPLPIPASTQDWLNPGTSGGPQGLFGSPNVASLVKEGDKLLGVASVTAPNVKNGKSYIVSIQIGKGGWYSEIKTGKGELRVPTRFDRETKSVYFEMLQTVKESDRIPITDPKPITDPIN